MKIFNVTFTTRLGGLEQIFLDYNKILSSSFEIISIIHKYSKLEDRILGKFYSNNNFSKYDPFALFKLWKIIKQESPDLIVTHGNRAHYMMRQVSGNIPIIGVAHGDSFDHITKCDYIISISKNIKDSLAAHNYNKERIIHIPNFIQIPDKIKYEEPKFHKAPIIGAIARFDKIKGLDILIKALKELDRKKIKFKCKIAGDGVEASNLKKLTEELGLTKRIDFLGWIDNKEEFYKNTDIICVPSIYESFGLVILEALIHSKPVIVSNVSGPSEIINNSIDGMIFNSGDYFELAQLIENLLSDSALVKLISKNAFEKASLYDINKIGARLTRFLQGIIK